MRADDVLPVPGGPSNNTTFGRFDSPFFLCVQENGHTHTERGEVCVDDRRLSGGRQSEGVLVMVMVG